MGKRKHQTSGLGYVVIPENTGGKKQSYAQHVELRARISCLLYYSVAHLCVKYDMPKSYEAYFSDTAAVQVDQGVRVKSEDSKEIKLDAAHLTNTSFLKDKFLADVPGGSVSFELREYCDLLETESGATTPQSKYDNIGPDKVIDSYQTRFKNDFLKNVKKTGEIPGGQEMYGNFVTGLNRVMAESKSSSFKKQKSSGFEGAQSAKQKMDEMEKSFLAGSFDWALDTDFKEAAKDIEALT